MVTAHDVRAFAQSNGIPVSKRGRVGREVLIAFLSSNPGIVRQVANANDIPIGKRGRISQATVEAVAGVL